MTTTLRPTEPLQREADGARSRRYKVCVNSRPVGAIELATDPAFGDRRPDRRAGIDEPDRRRGRGTVAALAAEEVLRGWGCARVEVAVPADADRRAARSPTALGYTERNRRMARTLGAAAPELPAGSVGPAHDRGRVRGVAGDAPASYAQSWIERGVPDAAGARQGRGGPRALLPRRPGHRGHARCSVLDHEGTRRRQPLVAARGRPGRPRRSSSTSRSRRSTAAAATAAP